MTSFDLPYVRPPCQTRRCLRICGQHDLLAAARVVVFPPWVPKVACGSGLELIYEFLQSDEAANRPELLAGVAPQKKVGPGELPAGYSL